MNQYLITGYDYTDKDALQRRINVRPHHLDFIKALKETSNYIVGGAILNAEKNMIGTVMILQFETVEALDSWKQREPYITQKIWDSVDIKPFRVADV
jgi:uncharacterized protein YciI